MIKLLNIIVIMGAFISLVSACISFWLVGRRLNIEKELERKIFLRLLDREALYENLKHAKNKADIKDEVGHHIKDYEELVSSTIGLLSQEKAIRIYPAIFQASKKGKVSYISKLISGSLEKNCNQG